MSRSTGFSRPDPAVLEKLRARIRRIESPVPEDGGRPGVVSLGVDGIDGALPWGGLPRAALHEVLAVHGGSATGFCAALLARLAGAAGTVLWCRRGPGLYGPGLAAFGLVPERLILVRPRSRTDVLWVLEEGLRSRSLAAVLGETEGLTVTAARRLQLAAESGGVAALLLRPAREESDPTPAVTRWRVATAPGTGEAGGGRLGLGRSRWQVELLKCRAGAVPADGARRQAFGEARSWLVEWGDGKTAGDFSVAADLRHRPAEPADAEGRRLRIAV